jgi:hypothetical protein
MQFNKDARAAPHERMPTTGSKEDDEDLLRAAGSMNDSAAQRQSKMKLHVKVHANCHRRAQERGHMNLPTPTAVADLPDRITNNSRRPLEAHEEEDDMDPVQVQGRLVPQEQEAEQAEVEQEEPDTEADEDSQVEQIQEQEPEIEQKGQAESEQQPLSIPLAPSQEVEQEAEEYVTEQLTHTQSRRS